MKECLILFVPVYFVSLLVGLTIGASSTTPVAEVAAVSQPPIPWTRAVLSHPSVSSFVVSGLILFLVPYAAYFLTRAVTRRRVRHAVSNQRFTEVFLPETLDYSLVRADLLAVLFNGELIASQEEHIPSIH